MQFGHTPLLPAIVVGTLKCFPQEQAIRTRFWPGILRRLPHVGQIPVLPAMARGTFSLVPQGQAIRRRLGPGFLVDLAGACGGACATGGCRRGVGKGAGAGCVVSVGVSSDVCCSVCKSCLSQKLTAPPGSSKSFVFRPSTNWKIDFSYRSISINFSWSIRVARPKPDTKPPMWAQYPTCPPPQIRPKMSKANQKRTIQILETVNVLMMGVHQTGGRKKTKKQLMAFSGKRARYIPTTPFIAPLAPIAGPPANV